MNIEAIADTAELIEFRASGRICARACFPDPGGGGSHFYVGATGTDGADARRRLGAFLRAWDRAARPREWSGKTAALRFGSGYLDVPTCSFAIGREDDDDLG